MNVINSNDTIAAISTPALGTGGISIIRISGGDAIAIADRIFMAASGVKLCEEPTHTIHYGHIVEYSKEKSLFAVSQGDRSADTAEKPVKKEVIDEVLASVMRAPKTFTAEDTVEINCHGGIHVTKKVLEEVLKAGARLAEPGEFTKRAFLNGRIDLAQAEGVIDVINSKNDFSLKASVGQINGRLSKQIKSLRDGILDHTAFMEAAMDDPEHISMDGHLQELITDIDSYLLKCEELLKGFDEGRLLKEGISTCILGRTNAGKSSLLNLFTGTETAIVTDIEGTTRDMVRESVRIDDIVLNLTDTAGIRDTDDEVEAIGVRKALEAAGEAELIIYVVDASKQISCDDKDILSGIKDKPCIILLNKADLELKLTPAEANKAFKKEENNAEIITFSTATGEGLEELKSIISKKFHLDEIMVNDAPVSVNVRHKECLESAKKSLLLVHEGLNSGVTEDLLFVDMMDAYAALGLILGEEIEDDLADRIFEKFCMGK